MVPDNILLISMPGASEWLIILVVIILLFGAKKIPELAKGIGKGIREFKDAKDETETDKDKASNPEQNNSKKQ